MEYIHDTVNKLIEDYGTRDPFELCDALGIKVIQTLIKPLQGAFYYIAGKPVVFIEESLRDDQKLLVCAHELGHYILHSDIVKTSSLAEFELFDMRDPVEYEANVFASHLMIDEKSLLELLKEGRTVFQVSMILKCNVNLINIKLTEMNGYGYNFDTSWGNHDLFS